jgi:hypothetical protein
MNFFVHKSVTDRYAKDRPYFHLLVIEKIKTYLQLFKSGKVVYPFSGFVWYR